MLQDAMNTHAWPTIRFVEIEDWAKSRQYALIAQGDLAEAERHPFQYLPETVADDGLGTAELIDSTDEPEPVLRQAASETVGLWKNRVALRQLRRPLNAPRRNAFRVTEWHCQVGEFAWSLPRSVVGRGSAAEHRQAPLHAAASRQRPGTS
jgi:hypothetical protein